MVEEEQPAGTQTRGVENPVRRNTRQANTPTNPPRPRSSLSYTFDLLKEWTSFPSSLGMLMMSRNAIVMESGVRDTVSCIKHEF